MGSRAKAVRASRVIPNHLAAVCAGMVAVASSERLTAGGRAVRARNQRPRMAMRKKIAAMRKLKVVLEISQEPRPMAEELDDELLEPDDELSPMRPPTEDEE